MAYTTINKSTAHFNTVTWSGDSTTPKNITGVGFTPDLIWGKSRNTAYNHKLYDSVRTFGNDKELSSSETTAEGGSNSNQYGYLSGTVSDGFTTTKGSDGGADGYGYWNESGRTYVAWNWKANGAGSANTDGSINTTATSVNTTAGFSICKYTGTGSAATVGHGLGAVPQMIITKNLDEGGGNQDWCVYHKDVGSNGAIFLNLTNTKDTHAKYFNDTNPTSSVFSIGTNLGTNGSGDNMIAYCFAEKTGYSKFGSYTGNGNADGTFIYTGFKPAFLIFKRTDTTNNWIMYDNKRNEFNVVNTQLYADSSGAEGSAGSGVGTDILSNGFKQKGTGNSYNASGGTYIYMAFGQSIVGSNNIPATAR